MEEIDLEGVHGGTLWTSVRHGLYEGYKTALSYPTAAIGGWKLAGQMYGSNATTSDRFRAMRDMQHLLATSETLPEWAGVVPEWAGVGTV